MSRPGRPAKAARPREAFSLAVVEALAEARREANLTRQELATTSGISSNTIAKIEQAAISDPGFSAVAALAHALDLDLNHLASQARHARPSDP